MLTSSVGNRLLSLDISGWKTRHDDHIFRVISDHCGQLRYLDFSSNQFRDFSEANHGLISIAKGCPHLKCLKLRHCNWVNDETTQLLLYERRASGDQLLVELEVLDIRFCAVESTIPMFSTLFPQLNRFDIRDIKVECGLVEEFLIQHSSANQSEFIELILTVFEDDYSYKIEFDEMISKYPKANVIVNYVNM